MLSRRGFFGTGLCVRQRFWPDLLSIATTGLSANDIIVKFTYHYNDLGLRDKVTAQHGCEADGRTTEWSYDDVGRLIEEHFKSAGPSPETLLRYIYTYDAAGNRTAKKTDYDDDNGSFAATATYTNNGYNQLTAVSGTPGRGSRVNVTGTIPTAWTLAAGDVTVTPNSTPANAVNAEVRGRFFIARNVPLNNSTTNSIVASTDAETLADHSPSSDTVQNVKLDTSLDEDYVYDANGNLIVKKEENETILWSYSYSVDGWLTKVEGPDGFVEEYEYDPIGRKYKTVTTEGGQTTTRYFVYSGGNILLELDSAKELEKEFIRGMSLGGGIGGLLYVRDDAADLGYFNYDGQGNVVSVTDEAREEVAYYEYDAWGNILTSCGSLANEFAFSTKQASLGTGLIDFGYRHYDPTTARWTQRDPVGILGGTNLYRYAAGDPLNLADLWGLKEGYRKIELKVLKEKGFQYDVDWKRIRRELSNAALAQVLIVFCDKFGDENLKQAKESDGTLVYRIHVHLTGEATSIIGSGGRGRATIHGGRGGKLEENVDDLKDKGIPEDQVVYCAVLHEIGHALDCEHQTDKSVKLYGPTVMQQGASRLSSTQAEILGSTCVTTS